MNIIENYLNVFDKIIDEISIFGLEYKINKVLIENESLDLDKHLFRGKKNVNILHCIFLIIVDI